LHGKIRTGKHLSDNFSIQNGLKSRCFIATAFQFYFGICHWVGPGKPGVTEIKWDTSAVGLSGG
jgi:hypothetical protein